MTRYHDLGIPEFSGNPLIEALPNFASKNDVISTALKPPAFSREEANHEDLKRDLYTERLDSCIIPNNKFYKVYKKIYKLLLKSYKNRNPLNIQTKQLLNHVASKGTIVPYPTELETITAPSLFVTGLSGMGKTYMIEAILQLFFPQIIQHVKYKHTNFREKQITYIKLNVPSDGSRRALCLNFFKAIDKVTGTNYESENKNKNKNLPISDLELNMKKTCLTHHIGLIVIDELQNLSLIKSGGSKQAMAFFESFSHEVNVSFLFIGTYDSYDIYSDSFKTARRMGKDGTIDLEQPLVDDLVWNQLVDVLWRYQWVSSPVPITEDIKKLLHDLTQGITFCTVTLLKFANVQAIEDGEYSITEETIRQAYKEEFKLFMPALDALRDKNYAAYDDLMPLAMRRILKRNKRSVLPATLNIEGTLPEEDCSFIEENSTETVKSSKASSPPEEGAPPTIDKIQRQKRLKESTQDVYDRLDSSGFFITDLNPILGN